MSALALDTFNLTKRFGAFTALDAVSLAVRPGTVHALLGENGAGKSTLVKCVVGYQRADAGSVLLELREVLSGQLRLGSVEITVDDRTGGFGDRCFVGNVDAISALRAAERARGFLRLRRINIPDRDPRPF